MSDPRRNRLERDVEDALLRLRQLENGEASVLRDHFIDYRRLRDKVDKMNLEGTPLSVRDIRDVKDDVKEIKETLKTKADQQSVAELKAQQDAIRATIRSTLITSAASIATSLILFAILKATGGT